jgi:hypothetical protein
VNPSAALPLVRLADLRLPFFAVFLSAIARSLLQSWVNQPGLQSK